MLRKSEHLVKGHKRTKATMVVAKSCTWNIRMKGGNFGYLTTTTTWGRGLDSNQRPLGYEPSHLNTDIPRYVERN